MQIRLSWQDLDTQEWRTPVLTPPVAFGRAFDRMPATVDGDRVSRIVLNCSRISRFHALITWEGGNLMVTDTGSRNGVLVNGFAQTRSLLNDGDTIQIDRYLITISFVTNSFSPLASSNSQIFFHPQTDLPDPQISTGRPSAPFRSRFPPLEFLHASQVSLQTLEATGLPVQEVDFLTVGAGLGSFVWVDLLRICGIKINQIMALGLEPKPYARYQRLCLNSQIPHHERLRSNSDSCPDNIWGWPSYGLQEAWQEWQHGHLQMSLKLLWQIFAEPTFAETYTPRSGMVFQALDREAKRIGWEKIYQYGRVRAIRQTKDGRYAIAVTRSQVDRRDHGFVVARYVHLATGYPAIQFLPDLQAYREATQDFKSVVNAYEDHQHVYQHLEQYGGTVILRGRGIVASRILQRLYEARHHRQNIFVLHLMRSPKAQGNEFEKSGRRVEHHFEFQPFNWPKACWGGELRERLELADPNGRSQLLESWGGTTTANRQDWREIVSQGLKQGWYRQTFGTVERVEQDNNKRTVTTIREYGINGHLHLTADFIIDATGLEAHAQTSPLLEDLVTHYNLPLNPLGRFSVAPDFEIPEFRSMDLNGRSLGRLYAVGAITLGNFYAPVDSFLGLQYAALRSIESLATISGSGVQKFKMMRSLQHWLKWIRNQSPD